MVVGRVVDTAGGRYVEPIMTTVKQSILIEGGAGCKSEDIVQVDGIVEVDGLLRGKVASKIEGKNTLELAVNSAIVAGAIRHNWPEATANLNLPQSVTVAETQGRRDLRNTPLVTIDGESARDFDDAVYAERKDDHWLCVIAVADVAHYVAPGSVIDTEAQKRGTSVYFPDRVIPMLPRQLSNGICSLNPNVDRLTLVCEALVGFDGTVRDASFYEAVIQSRARLTYSKVAAFLKEKNNPAGIHDKDVRASVTCMWNVARTLRQRRFKRGALALELPEVGCYFENGEPTKVRVARAEPSHQLIEEFMLLANQCVAEYLTSRTETINRVHPQPLEKDLNELRDLLEQHGVDLPQKIPNAATLVGGLEKIKAKPQARRAWKYRIIQTMALAEYSTKEGGHFGLATDHYLHFTSPIRRYPDLFVHRQLKAVLRNESATRANSMVAAKVSELASLREREAQLANRNVDQWLLSQLLVRRIGRQVTGTIASVTKFGLFVELDGTYVSGLLHISELGDDRFHLLGGHTLLGSRTKRAFRFGDRVVVRITKVDPAMQKIDLTFVSFGD